MLSNVKMTHKAHIRCLVQIQFFLHDKFGKQKKYDTEDNALTEIKIIIRKYFGGGLRCGEVKTHTEHDRGKEDGIQDLENSMDSEIT